MLVTGANRLWISYESPSTLVDSYGEYGHGDPDGESRLALDWTVLPEIKSTGNLRLFNRTDLLGDFMRTFQVECSMAAALKQPVLLMNIRPRRRKDVRRGRSSSSPTPLD